MVSEKIKVEIEMKLAPFKNIYPDWYDDIKHFIIKKIEEAKGDKK